MLAHLHTGLSIDAGGFGNTVSIDDAYRLARGEQINSAKSIPVKLARPLDWLIVTDHTDLMGVASNIQNGTDNILAIPKDKAAGEAAFDLIGHFSQMTLPKQLVKDYSPGSEVFNRVW